ncbi:transcriptional repressor LexA [Thiohalorhabdus methylotrophus]|uniref:LexA repressor n=1 Tax=Thiohalorhabdus methylotrophus TaxID=3242694 RepID=A0ABV4TZ83_9GAMM
MTPRQREILDLIRAAVARDGVAPTLEELARDAGVASKATVHKHLAALEAAGRLRSHPGRARGLELTDEGAGGLVTVPLLGRVAAGRPIDAVEEPETIQIPEAFRGSGATYVLQVHGDSMAEDGILHGDWVIVERRDTAEDGEVVVALVDGGEVTLKRIHHHGGTVVLAPANAAYAPLEYDPGRVWVRGVVIGQMRSYRKR